MVIVAAYNTEQARVLEGHNSFTISLDAARGVIAQSGIDPTTIDGVYSKTAPQLIYALGLGPVWNANNPGGITGVLHAASVVAAGLCETVLVADGEAGRYTERESTAPWTRPSNEFVAPFGLYTASEFALIARRHMHRHGTTSEQMAAVAARIRNNGNINPDAIYYGRGPFTVDDILASRMIADPFHLLDCAMTSEGGCALIVTTAERAKDLPARPSTSSAADSTHGAVVPARTQLDLGSRSSDIPNGYVGRRAARTSFAMAGLTPADVDVAELYDPFSFEIIRQFEAFGFCGDGEGGEWVVENVTGDDPRLPMTTDGGLMSYSHGGGIVQLTQRIARGVHQLQGVCETNQVDDAQVVLCSNGGAGAFFTDVLLLGSERP
ncbi:thiolase family protein [Rhodococcus hoagii]|nr:thiolase family protein [Prescottella equi]